MATNISLGSHFGDGVRTGPYLSNQLSTTSLVDANSFLSSNNYNSWGPGVLMSPIFTWNITPAAPNDGFTTLNNLVSLTQGATVLAAGNLTLVGDNSVTFTNAGIAQFDWPRVPTVTISGANAPEGTQVTIFGTDWWGFPLQHTYIVSAQGTYPHITLGEGNSGNLSVPAKAFYTVNRVYVDRALSPAEGCAISLGCADVFGLPYLTSPTSLANVVSIGWDQGSELSSFAGEQPLTALGVYKGGVVADPTNLTGDVRGLYGPSTAADGVKKLKFTYYVEGDDVWQNQVANKQQIYMSGSGSPTPQGVAIAPLTLQDLVGRPEFYTGRP